MLPSIYLDTKSKDAFTSKKNVAKTAKTRGFSERDVTTFLEKQDAFTKHKPIRHTFPRRKTTGAGMFLTVQADLVDMSKYKSYNDEFKFLLTLIDVYTRMLFVRCLKNKSGTTVASALQNIFLEFVPSFLNTDLGKEFYNSDCKKLFDVLGIDHNSSDSPMKASMVERANRTLKTRIAKYMTQSNSKKYIHIIDEIVTGINHSLNRSIGMRPVDVTENIFQETTVRTNAKEKFGVGDFVRISKERTTFQKGYEAGFSEELFLVSSLAKTTPHVYRLKDLNGEHLSGIFYAEELSKTNPEGLWKVETILKKRRYKGKSQCLVKWLGYNDSFNSWVNESSIVAIR